jgi:hypothetical protein
MMGGYDTRKRSANGAFFRFRKRKDEGKVMIDMHNAKCLGSFKRLEAQDFKKPQPSTPVNLTTSGTKRCKYSIPPPFNLQGFRVQRPKSTGFADPGLTHPCP